MLTETHSACSILWAGRTGRPALQHWLPWIGYPLPGCTAAEPDSVSPTTGSIDNRANIVKAINIGSLVMPEKTD